MSVTTDSPDDLATRAAAGAGVAVRTVAGTAEIAAVAAILDSTWVSPTGRETVPRELLVALAHAGDYVVAAYRGSRAVGAAVGFFAAPRDRLLHSHVLAVHPDARGHGVGVALKLHQRAWALDRGVTTIAWTFDPLVARNAYVNVERLGAGVSAYLPDFYGRMDDDLNPDPESDRALAEWHLPDPPGRTPSRGWRSGPLAAAGPFLLAVGPDQRPVRPAGRAAVTDAPRVAVQVPPSIETLRAERPAVAGGWRPALREALGGLLADGWRVTGFHREGAYVLERS